MGILAVALAASLAACSDDPDSKSDSPSNGESESSDGHRHTGQRRRRSGSIDCPEFADVGAKIVEAQTDLYAPSGAGDPGAAIDDLVAELDGLKEGAPEDVQEALSELGDGFERAAELLEDATQQGQAELLTLAPQLAEAGQNDHRLRRGAVRLRLCSAS